MCVKEVFRVYLVGWVDDLVDGAALSQNKDHR
jgi:hypothetical protein